MRLRQVQRKLPVGSTVVIRCEDARYPDTVARHRQLAMVVNHEELKDDDAYVCVQFPDGARISFWPQFIELRERPPRNPLVTLLKRIWGV